MSYTPHIDERLWADHDLINNIRKKRYWSALTTLNGAYGFYLITDQSGVVFDTCVDFCAQAAGNVEDAKKILVRLFETFYERLPSIVRENFAYLAEEIGYNPRTTNLQKLRRRYSDALPTAAANLTSMLAKVRELVAQAGKQSPRRAALRQPHSAGPVQSAIPASMLMLEDEEFILEIPAQPDIRRAA